MQARVHAERDADHDGHGQGGEGQLEGGRHALDDQLERRLVEDEGPAEIAPGRIDEEVPVLLVNRAVEPERPDRRLDIRLIGVGADQRVDRVSDCVDAEEHDERHHQDDDNALHCAANDENGHRTT